MIHQLNFEGKDKVEIAIERLQTYEPEEGYWVAFSGGKDSVAVKALCDMAGVKYDAHYSVTSVDPPELIYFIKEEYPDVEFEYPRDKDGNRISMWTQIAKRKIPPTRIARYCCAELKESCGIGRITVTGVRWAESSNRKKNQGIVNIWNAEKVEGIDTFNRHGGGVLRLDNSENKKIVDMCYKDHKTLVNPIIDWTDAEVWEFIREYEVPYCKLYDEGYKRLGCIGCPMSTRQAEELEKYPKYKALYLKAFEKMLENLWDADKKTTWTDAESVMTWWLQQDTTDLPSTLITEELGE